ncbi:GGDEF domain-containing protein [Roseateles violae]|uniref:diguanylate cyclase n=1 Tax=Roseateles violae TaxID=3058042 RepID=A0ABT8DQ07_9BURK|nr:GGDEF domain-containing protein [Pelomonas sp. PFR6]MDN3919024.1 GGDEF domain-containing protein [Pelomonas sp. PFR6]
MSTSSTRPDFRSSGAARRLGSMRRRMAAAVLLLSLLLVALTDALHIANDAQWRQLVLDRHMLSMLLRDIALVLLLSLCLCLALDRLLLRPLRRLAASTEAFDPTRPPPLAELVAAEPPAAEPAELQQISDSISRVHQRLWLQLRDEQDRAAQLRAEIERQQEALQQARQALELKSRELGSLSRVDTLTGLPNRREFDEALRREFKRAQRLRSRLALAVLDLDHFKRFNEVHGNVAGDVALSRFAGLLAERVKRDTDLVARLGGEEFVALLPGSGIEEAVALLEPLREELRVLALPQPALGPERVLTISIGLAAYSPAHPYLSPLALLQAADEALYIAKHAGRDRISLASSKPN